MAGSDTIIAYIRACQASEKASRARADLPAGSSRAKITTANARWTRLAEEKHRLEMKLRTETVIALLRELQCEEEVKEEDPDQLKLFGERA